MPVPVRLAKAALVVAIASVTACAGSGGPPLTSERQAEVQSFVHSQPSELQPFFRALYVEGERNAVLNFNYLGLAAMELGRYDIAEKAFDQAIARIEAIYADDPNARKAKSLWNEEAIKDFKGEPYERSMAYFYRGLLYLRASDYQNARAMFLSAERHDTLSAKEEFQGDFGLMSYLAAWASHCDGDDARARELAMRAVSAQPERFGDLGFEHSFLGLVDAGTSPMKAARGQHSELLVMLPSPVPVEVRTFAAEGASLPHAAPVMGADIDYQATTRGGRPVQAILDGKAKFKNTADSVGDAAVFAGSTSMMASTYTQDHDLGTAGAIVSLLGMASKIAAAATTPEADTRYWGSLPSRIFLAAGEADPKEVPQLTYSYAVSSSDGETEIGHGESVLNTGSETCQLAWGRTHSALAGAEHLLTPEPAEKGREERNRRFRAALQSMFKSASPPAPEQVTAASIGRERE